MIERCIQAIRCKVSTKVLLTKQRVTPGANMYAWGKTIHKFAKNKGNRNKSLGKRRYINDEMKM